MCACLGIADEILLVGKQHSCACWARGPVADESSSLPPIAAGTWVGAARASQKLGFNVWRLPLAKDLTVVVVVKHIAHAVQATPTGTAPLEGGRVALCCRDTSLHSSEKAPGLE